MRTWRRDRSTKASELRLRRSLTFFSFTVVVVIVVAAVAASVDSRHPLFSRLSSSSSSSSSILPLITRRECGPLVSLAFRPMSWPLSHPAFDSCQLMSLFVQRLHGYLLKRSFLLPTVSSNGFLLNPSPPPPWIDRWPRCPRWIGPRRRRIFRRTLRTRTTPRWRLSFATASRISPLSIGVN